MASKYCSSGCGAATPGGSCGASADAELTYVTNDSLHCYFYIILHYLDLQALAINFSLYMPAIAFTG